MTKKPPTPTPRLRISDELSLPLSFVTATHAILGKKRGGKSYKSDVIAEEMLEVGRQIVIIDPTGAHWGLRSSADGQAPGYPITIFGGEHGDLPLEPTAGEEIADAIIADGFSAILDLTDLTKGGEQRFCADFLERFYRKNKRPVHMFLDEADIYAPQRPMGDEARTLGACQSIVRRGGIKGIGITMITQRPAELNKGVLSQVDMLTLLKMVSPPDLDAIENWVKRHDEQGMAKDLMKSLPNLPRGDAWVWAPADDIFERITFRNRRTFDSGRTPEVGGEIEPPKVLAAVDLERLGKVIAGAAQRAKDNDPKELKKKIGELERKIGVMGAIGAPAQEFTAEMQRIATERDDAIARHKESQAWADTLEASQERLVKDLDTIIDALEDAVTPCVRALTDARNQFANAMEDYIEKQPVPTPHRAPISMSPRMAEAIENTHKMVENRPVPPTDGLSRMERAFLTILAHRRARRLATTPKAKVLMLAGYATGGAPSRAFGTLEEQGLIAAGVGGVEITDKGIARLGSWTPPPVGDALYRTVIEKASPMERAFLGFLHDRGHDRPAKKTEILAATQYAQGGAPSRAFAKLEGMGYIVKVAGGVAISPDLVGKGGS